jgi:hypothetical protein
MTSDGTAVPPLPPPPWSPRRGCLCSGDHTGCLSARSGQGSSLGAEPNPSALEMLERCGDRPRISDQRSGISTDCLCETPEIRLTVSYCSSRTQDPQTSKVYVKENMIRSTSRALENTGSSNWSSGGRRGL